MDDLKTHKTSQPWGPVTCGTRFFGIQNPKCSVRWEGVNCNRCLKKKPKWCLSWMKTPIMFGDPIRTSCCRYRGHSKKHRNGKMRWDS